MNFYKVIFPALLLILFIGCKENSTGPEEPEPEPECSISVSSSNIELELEESKTVSGSTEGTCTGSISWESSNSDIVSLDSNSGTSVKATGQSEGETSITASIEDQDGNSKTSEINAKIVFNPIVVYQKQTNNESQSSDIWIADKNGNERQVTNESKNWDGINFPVQWIDDGERIAYLTHKNDPVYSVSVEGGDKQLLTSNDIEAYNFGVSHDGNKVAFEGINQNDKYGIHIQDLGSEETTLFVDESRSETPKWSPDDKYISFTKYNIAIEDEKREIFGSDINIKKSDNSNESKDLTERSNTFDVLPSWSPDGEKIAFISQGENVVSTYVMDANGSNEKLVADNFYCTSWISNDELICMAEKNGDDFDLYRMNLDGSYEILMDTPEDEIYPDWKN